MKQIINPLEPHETLEQFFADLEREGGKPVRGGRLAEFDDMVRNGVFSANRPIFLEAIGVPGTKPQITPKGVTYIFHSAYIQDGRWVLRVTVGDATRSFSVPDLRLMLGLNVGAAAMVPEAI